jgi:hypothetical protein
VVGLEHAVMHEGVLLKRITEFPERPVHQEPVEDPFENGGVDGGGDKTNGGPKKEISHLSR